MGSSKNKDVCKRILNLANVAKTLLVEQLVKLTWESRKHVRNLLVTAED